MNETESQDKNQQQYADAPVVAIAENVLVTIKDNHLLIDIDLTHHKAIADTDKSMNGVGHL